MSQTIVSLLSVQRGESFDKSLMECEENVPKSVAKTETGKRYYIYFYGEVKVIKPGYW